MRVSDHRRAALAAVADPHTLRYCTCSHAEQMHRPACNTTRWRGDRYVTCPCERFAPTSKETV